jgi:hypothetical protein
VRFKEQEYERAWGAALLEKARMENNPFRFAKSTKTGSCAKNHKNDFFALMEKEEIHPRAYFLIFSHSRKKYDNPFRKSAKTGLAQKMQRNP